MSGFTGLVIGGTSGAADDPVFVNFANALNADAAVQRWHTPDATRTTLNSGRVASIANRKSGGAALAQSTAGQQPLYTAKGASDAPAGKPYISFVQARNDFFRVTGLPTGPTAAWWALMLIRIPAWTSNRYIMGGQADLAGTHFLRVLTGNLLRMSVGIGGGGEAAPTIGYTPATWFPLYVSWNGTLGRSSISRDGVNWTSDTSAGVSNAAERNIGAAIGNGGVGTTLSQTFDLLDNLGGTGDLIDGTPGMTATLSMLRSYVLSRYSLGPG